MPYLLDSKGHILTTDHFHMFVSVSVVLVGLNAVNVWFNVPRRRQIKDDMLVDLVDGTDTRVQTIEYSPVDRGRSRTLERLGGDLRDALVAGPGQFVIQKLRLVLWLPQRKARCRHNQSQILDVIVNKLWLQALLWDGEYDTSTGTTNRGVRFAPSHAAPYDGHLGETRVHAPHGGPCGLTWRDHGGSDQHSGASFSRVQPAGVGECVFSPLCGGDELWRKLQTMIRDDDVMRLSTCDVLWTLTLGPLCGRACIHRSLCVCDSVEPHTDLTLLHSCTLASLVSRLVVRI